MHSTSSNRTILGAASLLSLILSGCAAKTPPTVGPPGEPAVANLRSTLSAILNVPEFEHVSWGVVVQSIDSGDTMFALNPAKLMMPASNMKILTLASGAERLGWDYTFETRLMTAGPVEDGILKG